MAQNQVIKHVGRHGDKKIVLAYRQIPGDEHMCLVMYSDMLPSLVHNEVMAVLESPVGQNASDLADALFRHVMADGRNCLEVVHKSGYLKKVNTNQVIITPNAKSSVRLDELNGILNEMNKGEEAIKKLAELDAGAGMTGKTKREGRELGVSPASRSQPAEVSTATIGDVLSDDQLASQRIAQAAKMKLEAKALLAEAEKLEQEASSFTVPAKNVKTTRAKKATPAKKQTA
jgi:hypothetical protein